MFENCSTLCHLNSKKGNNFLPDKSVLCERLQVEVTNSDACSGHRGDKWEKKDGSFDKSRAHSPPSLNGAAATQLCSHEGIWIMVPNLIFQNTSCIWQFIEEF